MGIARTTGVGIALTALGAAAPAASARGGGFAEHVISISADAASAVTTADLNGDGHLDILVAVTGEDRIAWFVNAGDSASAFVEKVVAADIDGPSDVTAADLDGDGDLDVIVSAANDDAVLWYEQVPGKSTAFVPRAIALDVAGALSVATADVDGDGHLDVIAAASDDGTITWHESDGGSPPSFTAHVVTTVANGRGRVVAADVDGDGDVDVLSASTFGIDKIAWHENDGLPSPTFTEHVISSDAIGSTSVAAADLDGDGDLDVLSASGFDDRIAWYESDGGVVPSFTAHTITDQAQFARAVAARDLDGDGDVDVVSASSGDDTIAWYENDGASPPSFATRLITTSANGAAAVAIADVDDDGMPDVVGASGFDDTVAWYENLAEPVDPCAADITGDGSIGFMDLLAVLFNWGPCPPGPCAPDIDASGSVDLSDLIMVLQGWGHCG